MLLLRRPGQERQAGDFLLWRRRLGGWQPRPQAASKLTAELIEKNSDAVSDGMKAVNVTAQTLKASVEGARQVSHKMDKISETSVQQADAITQIRKSVELISEIVQGNSATSEESAAASAGIVCPGPATEGAGGEV